MFIRVFCYSSEFICFYFASDFKNGQTLGCDVIIKPRSNLAEYFSIRVCDRDNSAIANNLNPIDTVQFSETVVINLHIIGNTFVSIRINSHTMHFHQFNPIGFR